MSDTQIHIPAIFERPEFSFLKGEAAVAVGVSGGPDSMALAHLLCHWSAGMEGGGPEIHILSVDHGLRAEAAREAEDVGRVTSTWPKARHEILRWEGDKPQSRVQEVARDVRFDLLSSYCQRHHIRALFLAHHRDDQAETFLFRLAKGSGLDGLSCMRAVQERGGVMLCRPLLDVPKAALLAYCAAYDISFINDPSNEKTQFARVRLRQSMPDLEREGMSAKRLSMTASRLMRAREALSFFTDETMKNATLKKDTSCIEFKFKSLVAQPEEIVLRVVLRAMEELAGAGRSYAPRMEKCEALARDLIHEKPFRTRTLGGVIFSVNGDVLRLVCEEARSDARGGEA